MANKLVFIFQRFGADGLSTLVPHGDDNYYDLRPNTSLAAEDLLPINSLFGLHPALPYLHQRYIAGDVAFVHACGRPGNTLSHFTDQAYMETGGFDPQSVGRSGWASRLLTQLYGSSPALLRGLSFETGQPVAGQGPNAFININSYQSLAIAGAYPGMETAVAACAQAAQSVGDPSAVSSMQQTATLADQLRAANIGGIPADNGATYLPEQISRNLLRIAQMIKYSDEPAIFLTEKGSWDHHINMLPAINLQLGYLDAALQAFFTDLGARANEITVVIGTEFGRRAYENDSLGTDHGEGGLMMVIGKNVNGGIHGDWPGLSPAQRSEKGNLKNANDYRDVMRNIVTGVFGVSGTQAFPIASGKPFAIV